jgi:tetratricopeptide (TPR) repeat protein
LRPKLLGGEKSKIVKRYTEDPEAWDLYSWGRHFWNKRTEDGFKTAINFFEQATKKDPSYALAYAGLADCYNLLGYYAYMEPNEAFPKAKNAALETLEFDDKLAEAHASLGWVLFFYEWDWERTETEFKQALKLNPNYATAHHWYSVFLFTTGRFDESIFEIKRAQKLDPHSMMINTTVGWPYYFGRRYDDAVKAFQNALLIDEEFWYSHWSLGVYYYQKGMYEKALDEYRKAKVSYEGRQQQIETYIGITYARMGRGEEAKQVLDKLLERSKQKYVKPRFFADLYFALEDNDKGFDWLERARVGHDSWLPFIRVDPFYDSVRSDPRFIALLKKMNLEQ